MKLFVRMCRERKKRCMRSAMGSISLSRCNSWGLKNTNRDIIPQKNGKKGALAWFTEKETQLFNIHFIFAIGGTNLMFCIQIKTCNSLNKRFSARKSEVVCSCASPILPRSGFHWQICAKFQKVFFFSLIRIMSVGSYPLCTHTFIVYYMYSLLHPLMMFAHFWINNSLGN